MCARLLRVLRGDKRDYAPMSPILLEVKLSVMLERLMRVLRGYKINYAPMSSI